MRVWVFFLALCLVLPAVSQAQRKKKKDNGLSNFETAKKLNKQWIKLRRNDLPVMSSYLGVQGGFQNASTAQAGIELDENIAAINPTFGLFFNPTRNFGFQFALQYRHTAIAYNTTGSFANDTITANADGRWEQNFGNLGLKLGANYYLDLGRKFNNCTGFKIMQASSTHLYLGGGLIYAPSIINEVYFWGTYSVYKDGDLVESNTFQDYNVMLRPGRRSNSQLFGYGNLGLRFQNDKTAYRIGPFIDYQLNQNKGLVNDFTNEGTSLLVYGIEFGIEFF